MNQISKHNTAKNNLKDESSKLIPVEYEESELTNIVNKDEDSVNLNLKINLKKSENNMRDSIRRGIKSHMVEFIDE